MPQLLSLSTPSLLATSLTNLSSSRHRPPSLEAERKEGWTEVWGAKDNDDDNNTSKKEEEETNKEAPSKPYLPPRYIHVFNEECDYIRSDDQTATTETSAITTSSSSTTPKIRPLLTLSQYRVAWYEQIILRMCYIPHTVENSSYAAFESTGALPSLLDLDCGRVDNTYCHEQKSSASSGAVVEWGNTWNKYLSKLTNQFTLGVINRVDWEVASSIKFIIVAMKIMTMRQPQQPPPLEQ